jgi:hypothetical protein
MIARRIYQNNQDVNKDARRTKKNGVLTKVPIGMYMTSLGCRKP